MAFIAISTISFATPEDKLSSIRLVSAFFPKHISGKINTNINANQIVNTINQTNTDKRKMDSATVYGLNMDAETVVDMKYRFTYNTNGIITRTTQNVFVAGTSIPIYNTTDEYEYDQSGRIIKDTEKLEGGVNSYKYEYTYNDKNQLESGTESYWDDSSNNWLLSNKYEYEYNSKNKVITKLLYGSIMGDEFGLNGKMEYYYDDTDKLTEIMHYSFNEGYHKSETEKYEYAQNNNLVNIITYSIEFGQNNEELLIPSTKRVFNYDEANNRDIQTDYDINPESAELITTARDVYTFNNDYSANDLILPFTPSDGDQADFFSHMILSSISYTYNEGIVADSAELTYYYSEFNGSSVFDSKFTSAQISPNPSTGYVTFNWESNEVTLEVTVYDLSGQEVFSETVTKGEALSVYDLRTGAYIYKLRTAGKTLYGGKIVIL